MYVMLPSTLHVLAKNPTDLNLFSITPQGEKNDKNWAYILRAWRSDRIEITPSSTYFSRNKTCGQIEVIGEKEQHYGSLRGHQERSSRLAGMVSFADAYDSCYVDRHICGYFTVRYQNRFDCTGSAQRRNDTSTSLN
jgi:hypothetical protein